MHRPLVTSLIAVVTLLVAQPMTDSARPSMTHLVLHAWMPELGPPSGILAPVDRDLLEVAREVRRGRFRTAEERLHAADGRAVQQRDRFMVLLFSRELARYRTTMIGGGAQDPGGDTLLDGLPMWNIGATLTDVADRLDRDEAADAKTADAFAFLIGLSMTEVLSRHHWQSQGLASPKKWLDWFAESRAKMRSNLSRFLTPGELSQFDDLADGMAAAADDDPAAALLHYQHVLKGRSGSEAFALMLRIGDAYAFPAGDPLTCGVDAVSYASIRMAIAGGQIPSFAKPLDPERRRAADEWYRRGEATAQSADERRAVRFRMAVLEPTFDKAVGDLDAIANEGDKDVIGWAAAAAVATVGGRPAGMTEAITGALRQHAIGTAVSFAAEAMVFANTWPAMENDVAVALLEAATRGTEDPKLDRTAAELLQELASKYTAGRRYSGAVVAARQGIERQTRFIESYKAALARLAPPPPPEVVRQGVGDEQYILGRLILDWLSDAAQTSSDDEAATVAQRAWSQFEKTALPNMRAEYRESLAHSLRMISAIRLRARLSRALVRGETACAETTRLAAEAHAAVLSVGGRDEALEIDRAIAVCDDEALRRDFTTIAAEDILRPLRDALADPARQARLIDEVKLLFEKLQVIRALHAWPLLERWTTATRKLASDDARVKELEPFGLVLLADALRGQGRTDEALKLVATALQSSRVDDMGDVINVLMGVYVRSVAAECESGGHLCDPAKALDAYSVALFAISTAAKFQSGVTPRRRSSAEEASLETRIARRGLLEPDVMARLDVLRRARAQEPPGKAPVPSLTTVDIMRSMPARAVLLVYGNAEDDLVIWVIRRGAIRLVNRHDVERRVLRDAQRLQDELLDAVDARWQATADALSHELIEPVGPLADDEVVMIAADGVLAQTPFDVLPVSHGAALGDAHPIVHIESVLPLVEPAAPPTGGPPVVIGIDGDGITAAEREAKRVAEVLGTTPHTGAVELGAIEPAIRVAPIIHIAAHTHLSADNPFESYVSLGSGNRITAWELFRDAPAADLITLSACDTSMQASFAGGVATQHGPSSSLVSFAFSGGARFVLSSLWTASDEITADLMTSFYVNLAAGMDAVHALHEAKLAVRRSVGRLHPHYVANFRLTARNAPVVTSRLAKKE